MRRNMLLVTVDQWRGDCLGVAGHPVVRTPVLDALAAQGVRFSKHFAQCAPCGPSRASLHTGLYLHSHRSVDNGTPLEDRFTNMALEARALGYDPVLFGYTDTTLDPRTLEADDPALRTYESVLPGYRAELSLDEAANEWIDWLAGHGYDTSVGLDGLHHPSGVPYQPPSYRAEHTDTAFVTEQVVAYLDGADDGWFTHVSYLRPHPPFVVPEPYHSMYDPASLPEPLRRNSPEDEGSIHGLVRGFLRSDLASAPLDDDTAARWRAVYFAMMAEVDAQLGRLFDRIDFATTTVILTSDHGEMLGDHWLSGKLGFYPQSFHIPMIIAGAGVTAAGRVVDRFTENIDILPTVMDLIGGRAPAQAQGESLVPFLTDTEPGTWRDAAHWEWDFRSFGATGGRNPETCNLAVLHDDDGTYVHFAGGKPLFFDLTDDPGHFRDRTSDPELTERVLAYAQRLLTWRLQTDPGPLVNTNALQH